MTARELTYRTHRGALARAALAALLLALALAGLGPQQAPAKGPLLTAITDPHTTYLAPPLAFERIRGAGARYVRLTIGWSEIAPRQEPASWDPSNPNDPWYWWPNADAQVTNAVAAGLTPIIALTGAHPWGQRCERRDTPSSVCDPDPVKFAQFATAIAKRYSGTFPGLPKVSHWQIANEPNIALYFGPQLASDGQPISPEIYRGLLVRASAAIKSVDSSNLIVTAGLAPVKAPESVAPLDFTRRLLCMTGRRKPRPQPGGCGGGVPFDIFAMHAYTTGGPTHQAEAPDDIGLGDLPELVRLLRAADRAGHINGAFARTPLWITEFSWDTNPPDPKGLKPALHARWVAEALYRAWDAGVQLFTWFNLRDEDPAGRSSGATADSGLYYRGATIEQDQPKRALQAFRFPFVALDRRKGYYVWGRTPSSGKGMVEIQIRGKGGWRKAAELRAKPTGIFEATLRGPHSPKSSVRAVFRKERSLPFSLRYVKDFFQPPFG